MARASGVPTRTLQESSTERGKAGATPTTQSSACCCGWGCRGQPGTGQTRGTRIKRYQLFRPLALLVTPRGGTGRSPAKSLQENEDGLTRSASPPPTARPRPPLARALSAGVHLYACVYMYIDRLGSYDTPSRAPTRIAFDVLAARRRLPLRKWRLILSVTQCDHCDYREPNKVIDNHAYPLPDVTETIRAVREQACEPHRQDLENGVENPELARSTTRILDSKEFKCRTSRRRIPFEIAFWPEGGGDSVLAIDVMTDGIRKLTKIFGV